MNQSPDTILLFDTIRAIEPVKEKPDKGPPQPLAAHSPQTADLGALGVLVERYGYATNSAREHLEKPKKCTVICCADHGVAEMQVSAYPPETTAQMTANYLIAKGAVANALAGFAKSDLFVADLGIKAKLPPLPALIDRKIAHGTKNSAKGPAMTRDEAIRALAVGIRLADHFIAQGYRCFLPGEMGISNTTASAAITACLCQLTPEEATGRGTNISDERLKKKIDVVRRILEVNRPDASDGIDVLQKVGGFELGCIAGLILGAARKRAVVILDGFNTGAAALIAKALSPAACDYLLPSHLAAEPAHAAILKTLALTPCLDMRFRLGEATGSSIIADFLDAALEAAKGEYAGKGRRQQPLMADAAQAKYAADKMSATQHSALSKDLTLGDAFILPKFPAPDTAAMDACQTRIDSLAKPIDSLGRLEELAVRFAGITRDAQPPLAPKRALLIFTAAEPTQRQKQRTAAFAAHAEAPVTLTRLDPVSDPATAFLRGQKTVHALAADCSLIGISLAAPSDTAAKEKAALLEDTLHDAKCGDAPLDLLHRLPPALCIEAAALFGAISAAAERRSLILLDDPAGESVARCAETLSPTLSPYLLHMQSDYIALSLAASCGIAACLGMRLIDASLHMLNDMKTFAETAVAVAADGPGMGKQG